MLPILHGPFGEDGTVQGLCEMLDVPYVGAGVLGSALAMDKSVCKAVLRDAGIATAPSLTLLAHRDDPDDPALHDRVETALGLPVFVKPARLGSSVGISKAHDRAELATAIALAFAHDDKVLVERFVSGREVECGVLGNESPIASAVGEILPHNEWYDFEAKYVEGGSDIVIPARLTAEETAGIQRTSLAAFEACDLAGLARIDFFLEPDGTIVLNEINTMPGLHVDERLREPVRRQRPAVRRAADAADRPRAGAPRAPVAPALLTRLDRCRAVRFRAPRISCTFRCLAPKRGSGHCFARGFACSVRTARVS